MKIIRYILFFVIFIFMTISCTKEVDVQLELSNIDKNVTITIESFQSEFWGSETEWEREIFAYGTYEDFLLKVNPIFHDFTPRIPNPHKFVVRINNIKEDVLYLRVTIWEILNYKYKFNMGSYYYNDSIPIPEYNCNISVYTSYKKWKKE